ncbi:MAG: lytic transglycosylase domain-containing protein [Rickettsiaceae bacterium]|nr:MAG: lytic transglycosylase domain-containing protein [Rickettsiaceae bacterium]
MNVLGKVSIILISLFSVSNATEKAISDHIFYSIDNKDWNLAEKLAMASKDSALIKIVKSQKFLDDKANNNFAEIIDFVKQNAGWPQLDKIAERAEQYINDNTDKKLITQWFSEHKPKTSSGFRYYALAANFLPNKHQFSATIKNGWIYGNFTTNEANNYLKLFGKYLNEQDHVKRIDDHLWNNNIDEATKSLYLVNDEYKKAFKAAIASIDNHSTKEKLFSNVSPNYYTSSLLYYYLNSRKKEIPDQRAIYLFKKVINEPMHAASWCKLQLYYAREFIDQKDFVSSYRIITTHFAIDEENIREAEWLSGWLALRFLKKPQLALGHFQKLHDIAKKPISVARAKYWLGRTSEDLGNKQKAHKFYKEASIFSYTFYGQVAHLELKQKKMTLPPMPKGDLHHKKSIEQQDLYRATKFLLKYGKPELAHLYAKTLTKYANPEELVWLAQVIKSTKNNYYITDFGKHASQQHIFLRDYAFPTPYKLHNSSVDPAIVYSIIRQESVFNQYAISSAKAMGLMQLIKDTACRTAKDINIKCDIPRLLNDPKYNIKLGTHQLKMLLGERDNSLILTFASYNAAFCSVNKWIKRFGDPRELNSYREVIDWIELIPYSETRNYVQRILENIQVYRIIINNENQLKLMHDLGTNK